MARHAYWTGHIRLSLVTFPVRLYPAVTETEKIRLHKYDRESGDRIHYQNVNSEGDVVDPEDIIKGYEYEKGSFIPIEDKELEGLRKESKHTIDLVQFTEARSIDPIYYEKPYFIAPDGNIAHEAYITLREALRKTEKVALGQVVLGNRERIIALKPCGKGLLMETLRYNYEVRSAEDYFEGIEEKYDLDKDQLALAKQLIESKSGDFDPKKFKDLYQEGLLEIINAKLEHRVPELKEESKKPGKVINIMDALRQSLQQSKGEKKPPTAAKKSSAKKPKRTKKSA
ncbi:MAG: non-homologous end joining protein Ku [Micavibrio sp.]